jgi:pyruvate formate lyase activating enzyme
MTRREFIKSAAIGAAAIAAGAYGINELMNRSTTPAIGGATAAPSGLWKWSKEAYNYLSLGEDVKCGLCPNSCMLRPDERGICRVRVNKGGRLYSLVYGNPAAEHLDPVEKKPLFHFLPGTSAYSIGTAGCNLRCLNCQNWQISQSPPEDTENADMMPDAVVQNALKQGASSIAYTYNEPTVFYEYMTDTGRLAKAKGLRNIWVSNGYINPGPLDDLCSVIDAAHIDLKSFDDDTYAKLNSGRLQPVLDTIKQLHKNEVWFEMIHLVVPTWTDKMDAFKDMVEWIVSNVGPDRPLHISRFFPQYRLTKLPPTPTDYLSQARDAALDAGLRYVYVGNVPELKMEDTICPKCGKVVVGRYGYTITENNLQGGACRFCGEKVAGFWA